MMVSVDPGIPSLPPLPSLENLMQSPLNHFPSSHEHRLAGPPENPPAYQPMELEDGEIVESHDIASEGNMKSALLSSVPLKTITPTEFDNNIKTQISHDLHKICIKPKKILIFSEGYDLGCWMNQIKCEYKDAIVHGFDAQQNNYVNYPDQKPEVPSNYDFVLFFLPKSYAPQIIKELPDTMFLCQQTTFFAVVLRDRRTINLYPTLHSQALRLIGPRAIKSGFDVLELHNSEHYVKPNKTPLIFFTLAFIKKEVIGVL